MNWAYSIYHPVLTKVDFNMTRIQRLSQKLKTYRPNLFEEECYKLWDDKEVLATKKRNEVFSIILPPPNVTGTLHLGHAVTITIQDTIARWKRMSQNEVVWVPGVDHAGIATQAIVEKSIMKTKGISRLDIGEEKFIEEVWKWKHEKTKFINMQIKKLGASVDWSREFFTMDKKHMKAVTDALMLLYEKDLIYRDELLINWSPHLRSTISDVEVDHIELLEPSALTLPGYSKPIMFGNLIYFGYKVIGSDKEIVVSTTRIETMLGDVAVAVNPTDERYKAFWGSKLKHPFNGTEIPIIIDSRVDPSFGTGAVKITPAHDPTDFKIGKCHNLRKLSVINEEGILENCGSFSGMKRFEARDVICNELAKQGLLRQIRPHKMKIPLCSRSGDVIEYLIRPQWFLKCKNMAERAITAVKENKLIITPEKYRTNWFHWLENIQDWCISRQLWWGHQLPFYHCQGSQNSAWVAALSEEEALKKCRNYISGPVSVHRDPDVLDTWFSSGLLPFTSFGWPKETNDLKKYYPLSTLVTGNDILFFWVARMVMLGLELTNQLPFKEVFLHSIICDSQGRKMSKSLGNVIAPEDVINGKTLEDLNRTLDDSMLSIEEKNKTKKSLMKFFPKGIPEYGVDAMRCTLLSNNLKSQYLNFNVAQCKESKQFCNKIWQACNFADDWIKKLCPTTEYEMTDGSLNYQPNTLIENWILDKLNCMVKSVNEGLERGDFHIALNSIRNFIHSVLCDIYIEAIKPILQKGPSTESKSSLHTLMHTLVVSLKCLSPFMPFVSEYLYQKLPIKNKGCLIETSFPTCNKNEIDIKLIERMSSVLTIVHEIRRIKHDKGLNYQQIPVWIANVENELLCFKDIIETLAKCEINFGIPKTMEENYSKEFFAGITAYFQQDATRKKKKMPTSDVIEKINKLKKKLTKLLEISGTEGYRQKAPAKVQKSHNDEILNLKKEIENLESTI